MKNIKVISDPALNNLPIQVFYSKTAKFSNTVKQRTSKENTAPIFCHLDYKTNIANPDHSMTHYRDVIKQCVEMGISGCVVHVGKSLRLGSEEAIEIMFENLTELIEVATVETPVLLETPSGQGTELLVNLSEFVGFCKRFNDPRFGVCLDTCHVYVAGFEPSEYFEQLVSESLVPRLVHFNDSAREKNSRVDRHAAIGFGFIDPDELRMVLVQSVSLGIPVIREC